MGSNSRNRNKYLILLFLYIISFIFGCTVKDIPEEIGISLSYSIQSGQDVKSYPVYDGAVRCINVFAYNSDGELEGCTYSHSSHITLKIWDKKEYMIYAIANIPDITSLPSLSTEDGIRKYRHKIDNYSAVADSYGYIPMSFRTEGYVTLKNGSVLDLPMTRALSYINFKIDTSKLVDVERFDVKSVSLKNVPDGILFFSTSRITSVRQRFESGGIKNGEELRDIFTDGVDFLLFENMQGTLLGENRKQSEKVFPEGSSLSPLCTYLEVDVAYKSYSAYANSLKYRFYIGTDNVSNFDVIRNTRYCLTLVPHESGINENSWRLDISDLKYLVENIHLNRTSYTFDNPGETYSLIASITPEYAENKVIIWSSSDESVASVSASGTVTAIAAGECIITASSSDGSGKKAYCTVRVNRTTVPAGITIPSGISIYEGEEFSIPRSYIPEEASSLPLVWSIPYGNEMISVDNSGNITALKRGTASVIVCYKDYPTIYSQTEITVKPAVSVSPVKYLELMNYTLWPEKDGNILPSSVRFTIDKAPNADISWIISRNGIQREDIHVSENGLLTLGPTASGHYYMRAKASTGEYYSDYISMDIYYYLIYQDVINVEDASFTYGSGNTECDVTISMWTKWYQDRVPSGIMADINEKEIIYNSTDNSENPVRKAVEGIYLSNQSYTIVYNQSFIHSVYYEISPLSALFETYGNKGNAVRFRYDTGNWNYYYIMQEGNFYNDPTVVSTSDVSRIPLRL